MTDNQKLQLTTDSFYHLQNIYEVILELGEGSYLIEDLILVIDRLFTDFSKEEKRDLAVRVLKISAVIN